MNQRRLFKMLFVASAAYALIAEPGEVPKATSTQGSFEISLHLTARGDELFKNWDRPTGKDFAVESLKIAPRGIFLSAVLLFRGCRADSSGNCNAVVDIVAYDPKGKIYGEMPHAELWQQKPAPDPGYTQLSRSYMGLVIEPNDLPGTYRIAAVARDLNAKTEAKSVVRFEVK